VQFFKWKTLFPSSVYSEMIPFACWCLIASFCLCKFLLLEFVLVNLSSYGGQWTVETSDRIIWCPGG
jgi:hypothetical protein